MKKLIIASAVSTILGLMIPSIVSAAIIVPPPPPPPPPTAIDQCKKDGWRSYGDVFKNQGDCVSFVVTNGRNAPDGPPIN